MKATFNGIRLKSRIHQFTPAMKRYEESGIRIGRTIIDGEMVGNDDDDDDDGATGASARRSGVRDYF